MKILQKNNQTIQTKEEQIHISSEFLHQLPYLQQKNDSLFYTLKHHAIFKANTTAYAFIDGKGNLAHSLTYQHLYADVMKLASYLQSTLPKTYGERALIIYNNSNDFITAFMACQAIGLIAVPAYAPKNNHHMSRLNNIIENAKACCVLSHSPHIEKVKTHVDVFPTLKKDAVIDTSSIPDNTVPLPWQRHTIHPISLLQYTSGSTGNPKGVMVSQQNLVYNCDYIAKSTELQPTDRWLSWLPNYHDLGLISGFLTGLYLGITNYSLETSSYIKDPLIWIKSIGSYAITHSGGPNFAYQACVDAAKNTPDLAVNLSSWKCAFNGAERIRASTLAAFSTTFGVYGFKDSAHFPCYGLAEATVMVSGKGLSSKLKTATLCREKLVQNQVVHIDQSHPKASTFISVGPCILETVVSIIDPVTQEPCSSDQIGEIYVAGPTVTLGFWGDEIKTAEMFKTINGVPHVKTGDLGFLSDDKQLFITDRIKDILIINGKNSYPSDLEETIEQLEPHFLNNGTIVFQKDTHIVASIETQRHTLKNMDKEETKKQVQMAILNAYDICLTDVLFVHPLKNPRTSSGKKQRSKCKAMFLETSTPHTPQTTPKQVNKPASPIHQKIQETLNKLLHKDPLYSQAELIDITSNSLLLIKFTLELEAQFMVTITQNDIITSRSISSLASVIDLKQNEAIYSFSQSM